MHHGRVGTGFQEPLHNDVAVAFGVVVFEAEDRHGAPVKELADVGESIGRRGAVEYLAVPRTGTSGAPARKPARLSLGFPSAR